MSEIKKIAVMTGGGDCQGLNAVIRAAVKTAINKYKLEVVGIRSGYNGLYNADFVPLDENSISGILPLGGTILYSSNKDNLFDYLVEENGKMVKKDVSDVAVKNLKDNDIDAMVIIGGDGTLTSGRDYARKGVKVVGVPKTIDNDLACTDYTFGFDTAVGIITEAIDRLHTTACSHHRIIVVEVMGRYAGWLPLASGVAGGADVILLPEIPYDIKKVAEKINDRKRNGKGFSIVVVGEGAKPVDGEVQILKIREDSPDPIRLGGVSQVISDQLEALTGSESRAVNLGHVQRGGTPSCFDRILSTKYGSTAIDVLMSGVYGHMITLEGNKMSHIPLEDVIGNNKQVKSDDELVVIAKNIGISFGD